MKNPKLTILEKDIEDIKPYENNPKLHPQDQIEAIANSIVAYGFREPITIDTNGVIVKGHGRALAMRLLGRKTIPCYVIDDLEADETRGLRIADNKVAESGTNSEALKIELHEIDLENIYTGYSPIDAQLILHPVDIQSEESGGSGEPIISFTIVFDGKEQQEDFFGFVRFLKANGQEGSVAAKITSFLKDHADF